LTGIVSLFVVGEVFKLVIPEDEIQRFVQVADDEIVVVKGEISGGDYDIDVGEASFDIGAVDERIDMVGDTEELHFG
jgi:hypothetical protein